MKKSGTSGAEAEMRPEYDFSGGVRGKHHTRYREGHVVRILSEEGRVTVRYFTKKDGAVMLDPDVRIRFPDSESVNRALRGVMRKARRGGRRAVGRCLP